MATFTKLGSGSWRVQVRRKRQYVTNTFLRRHDAEEWARDVERSIDRGGPIRRARPHEPPLSLFRLDYPSLILIAPLADSRWHCCSCRRSY